MKGQLIRWTPFTEGPSPAFRPSSARSTLPASSSLVRLVQTDDSLARWPSRPRTASRRSSNVPARCLESASTTDVHATSTRRKHPLRRPSSRAVGNPPAFDSQTALCTSAFAWLRAAPDHRAVTRTIIRPPTAARLTACTADFGPVDDLLFTRLLTVRRGASSARRGRGGARAFSARCASVDSTL